ncbi:hypothetical protein IEQ34_016188 [Dendrobium chrysotoxum]|uniref:Uncharacterized protein n=1 Tax=Dendrobium chrysotoxum TaxID=161865 RepID=A0AAV7GF20_DENCH|nr:hypothetical protein IEQ34_016188 [Dendrobium chrysotoxum]
MEELDLDVELDYHEMLDSCIPPTDLHQVRESNGHVPCGDVEANCKLFNELDEEIEMNSNGLLIGMTQKKSRLTEMCR